MSTDIWHYEYPVWLSHYKDNKLFNLLPTELVKMIISNIIDNVKERIKKQLLIKNLQQIKTQIHKIFDKNIENFHFYNNEKVCDMDIVKSILNHTAKTQDKPIKISHICCSGKGIVFEYLNDKTNDETNDETNDNKINDNIRKISRKHLNY